MEFDTERIIDSNGQKYRVGWDEHGWFSIQMVAKDPETDEWVPEPSAEYPLHSFDADGADELRAAISERS